MAENRLPRDTPGEDRNVHWVDVVAVNTNEVQPLVGRVSEVCGCAGDPLVTQTRGPDQSQGPERIRMGLSGCICDGTVKAFSRRCLRSRCLSGPGQPQKGHIVRTASTLNGQERPHESVLVSALDEEALPQLISLVPIH